MPSKNAPVEGCTARRRWACRPVRWLGCFLSIPALAGAVEANEPPGEAVVPGGLCGTSESPLSCEAAENRADPAIAADVKGILAERRFRFCHQEGYRLWPHEKEAYCESAEALAERCPELQHACQRPAFGASEEKSWDLDLGWLFDWIPGFAAMARVLFWLILIVGAALLLRALVRNLADEVRRRRRREAAFVLEQPSSEQESTAAPEKDVQRLLQRARDEAARSDWTAAIINAYAAALRSLEQRSLLELHRSRTNGDYLRQLAGHPEERDRMRRIIRDVESVQFGRDAADRTRFERVMQHVMSLVGQAAGWCLLIVLPLCLGACDSNPLPDTPNAPTGPDGHALLETLLQRHSSFTQRRYRRLTSPLWDVTAFVALSPNLRAEEWDLLVDWIEDGGILLTAGITPELASRLQLPEQQIVTQPCSEPLWAPGYELRQTSARAFERLPGSSTLIGCGNRVFLASVPYGDGVVYALADDVWLRNVNVATADNASYLVHLLASPDAHIELLGPWTGSGTGHPFESIHNAGLSPWLLQLLLLALAYGVARGVRFGTPVQPQREHRRAFVEHAEALAQLYARSKASGHALEQYGRWAIERIRERVPVRDRDLHSLAHAVARRTGGEPMAILRILVEAQSAGQIQGAPEEHGEILEALSRILRDVGGAYGGSPT